MAELHLKASGRIEGRVDDEQGVSRWVVNRGSKVDGARVVEYDSERDVILVRVDHSTIPAFWMELELPAAKLEAWLALRRQEDAMEEEDSSGKTEQ